MMLSSSHRHGIERPSCDPRPWVGVSVCLLARSWRCLEISFSFLPDLRRRRNPTPEVSSLLALLLESQGMTVLPSLLLKRQPSNLEFEHFGCRRLSSGTGCEVRSFRLECLGVKGLVRVCTRVRSKASVHFIPPKSMDAQNCDLQGVPCQVPSMSALPVGRLVDGNPSN